MPRKKQGPGAEDAARDNITWIVFTGVIVPDVKRLLYFDLSTIITIFSPSPYTTPNMSAMKSTTLLSDITMDPSSSKVMDFTFIQPPELTKGFPVVVRTAATIRQINTDCKHSESGRP